MFVSVSHAITFKPAESLGCQYRRIYRVINSCSTILKGVDGEFI
jgi:hypothetical protein